MSVEKLLAQKPKATVKFNGDMAELSKKLLDTKLSEYKNYNKFILGEKELKQRSMARRTTSKINKR